MFDIGQQVLFPGQPEFRRRLGYLCAPDPQLLAHSNQVCQGAGPHFVHDLTALNFDSNLARAQFGRDLFVEQAGDDSFHHLPLARRQ